MSEDGRKQQAKLKELSHIAEKLGCTLPQLAVGESRSVILSYFVSNLITTYLVLTRQTNKKTTTGYYENG